MFQAKLERERSDNEELRNENSQLRLEVFEARRRHNDQLMQINELRKKLGMAELPEDSSSPVLEQADKVDLAPPPKSP